MQPVNELTYAQALAELEGIINTLNSDKCDVDQLTALTSRAAELLKHCRSRLTLTDSQLREILDSLQA